MLIIIISTFIFTISVDVPVVYTGGKDTINTKLNTNFTYNFAGAGLYQNVTISNDDDVKKNFLYTATHELNANKRTIKSDFVFNSTVVGNFTINFTVPISDSADKLSNYTHVLNVNVSSQALLSAIYLLSAICLIFMF